jgi:DNA-binding CsgD family transcriptional regulator
MLTDELLGDLIGTIYEAGALPERWPETLHKLATAFGARGGNLIRSSVSQLDMQSSPGIAELTQEFAREGWNERNSRVSRLLERSGHAGFLTDSHLHSEEELDSLPMYAEFLNPRGVSAGAATIVQGASDDALILAVEAFASHQASREAVPLLDQLRPHIARAAVLSGQIQSSRMRNLLEAFDTLGTPVGLLDARGRLLGASGPFDRLLGDVVTDSPARMRIIEPESDRRFASALAHLAGRSTGLSVAIRNPQRAGVGVLHLVPARHDARELFSKVSIFAVMAQPANEMLPGADIISALFDLTPAEARVARGIAQGLSPARIAKQLGVSPQTIRSQLKRVFVKTSTNRQTELSLLISRLV